MNIKKLHLLAAKAFVGPFMAGFSVTLFVLVLQFLAKYQNDIFGKGFGAGVIAQLFMYASVQLAVLALPVAVMMAGLTTLGNMGENYELAALKSCGVSLLRIIYPLLMITFFVTGFSFYLSWFVIPKANLKLYSLLYDLQQAKPQLALKPGYFENQISGYSMYYTHRSPTGKLIDLKIWDHSENRGNVKIILADSATVIMDGVTQYLRLTLYHGVQYYDKPPIGQQTASEITLFDSLRYKLDLSNFGLKRTDENWFRSHQYMLNIIELAEVSDSLDSLPLLSIQSLNDYLSPTFRLENRLKKPTQAVPIIETQNTIDSASILSHFPIEKQATILNLSLQNARNTKNFIEFTTTTYNDRAEEARKYKIEYYLKFSLPIACIVLLFIGAPMGAIIRQGGLGAPTVVALCFFIFFYVLLTHGRKLAREDVVPVWFGVAMPILVIMPMAIYLTRQAANDAPVLELRTYQFYGAKGLAWLKSKLLYFNKKSG